MGELRDYRVKVNGTETVLSLSDEDAKNLYPDATLVEDDEAQPAKARTTANKARTAETK